MKLCNIQTPAGLHVCAKVNGTLRDLTAAGLLWDMNGLIEQGEAGLYEAKRLLALAPEAEGTWGNVTVPGKIVCVGLNYADHVKETGIHGGGEPVLFSKFNDCLSPCGGTVTLPPWRSRYDYEAELVIVIQGETWAVDEAEAVRHIFGYTCGNDLSARDAQKASSQWLIGKSMPGFAPAGPVIVTADEFNPNESHRIRCLRGETVVQDDDVKDMLFSCARIVSYASHYFRLHSGDLIFTGTPEGTIIGMQPRESRVYLTPGEQVTVEIEGIGALVTRLA